MDEKQSREIALKLLAATSAEEVNAAMRSVPAFSERKNWHPYGNAEKNWDPCRRANQRSGGRVWGVDN